MIEYNSSEYLNYLEEQRQKVRRVDSKAYRGVLGLSWEIENFGSEKKLVIKKTKEVLPPSKIKGDILVVGARYGSDIDLLTLAGYKNILGIDIYDPPKHPKVLYLDAHFLSKLNRKFGLFYIYHVMEHLLYPSKVISEIEKVITPGGFVSVTVPTPLRKKEGRDAQTEFDSVEDLIKAFEDKNFRVHQECKLSELNMRSIVFQYVGRQL